MSTPREDFAKVFAKHQSWLYAFLVTLLGNVSDAEEVFQEVCVTLWSELDAFDLATDFRKWAGAIARNRVLNFRTKQYREAKRLSDVAVELVAQEMHNRADLLEERRQALRGCLDRLDAADRTLVELCYSDANRTFQAAAENLGRSVNTVYKQLQRVRKLLRDCVDRKLTARAEACGKPIQDCEYSEMAEANMNQGEIGSLVDAFSDMRITGEQLTRLNALLEQDADARREFVDLMGIEAELARVLYPLSAEFRQEVQPALATVQSTETLGGRLRRLLPALTALAAIIAFCIAGSSWLTYEGVKGRGPLASFLASGERGDLVAGTAVQVANVAATRNCRWGGDIADHLSLGSAVARNQLLELKTGVAELNFVNGARLILEGPASFQVKDANTVYLYNGRVAAALPATAEGFTLNTAKMTVRKSAPSTQYGVIAGGDGSDQVHVFEGALDAVAVDRGGRVANELRLLSLEAAAIEPLKHEFSRLNLDNDGFVRSIELRNGPGKGLLAFDDFSYPAGPLALQNGGFGWAGPWTVLEMEGDEKQQPGDPGGVSYGSLATSGVVALGNRFVQSDNFNRMRRVVSTSRGGVFDVAGCIEVIDAFPLVRRTGGSIYMSFLQRVTKRDGTFYGFELHRGDGRYNRVLHVGTGVDENGYGASVSFEQPAGQAKFVSLGEENDDVNFIVIRIDYGAKEKDKITFYRNPESIVDESICTVDAKMEGNFGFDRVSIGNFFGEKTHEIDEIRIGTDYQAVTGSIAPVGWHELSKMISRLSPSDLLARFESRSGAAQKSLRPWAAELLVR